MMRAPDDAAAFDASKVYGTFDPAQWEFIRVDLALVGIDLDTAMLPAMPDEPWWPTALPLRNAIQEIAEYYAALMRLQCKWPTPWQQAEELQAIMDAFAAALDQIERSDLADDNHTWAGMRARLDHTYGPACVPACSAGTSCATWAGGRLMT
jgi:hypothetical protein